MFYLVSGCVRIAIIGMGLAAFSIFLVLAIPLQRQGPLLIQGSLLGFFTAAIVAAALLILVGVVAVVYARWHRLRIWIDMQPQPDLVLNGYWPPVSDVEENGAEWIIGLPILLAMYTAFLLLDHSTVATYLVSILVAVIGMLAIRPVIARHPNECYAELMDVNDAR